jgi:hypothetical protein
MREWCSCGAAFHSLSNRRVTEWRAVHRCPDRAEPEPQKEGSYSSYERRPQYDHDSSISTIGFRANDKR